MSDQPHMDPDLEARSRSPPGPDHEDGRLVERAIADAACSLETRDEELAEAVRLRDAAIDTAEETITDEATRIIALRAPAACDCASC